MCTIDLGNILGDIAGLMALGVALWATGYWIYKWCNSLWPKR